jgi:tRNA dimethylallyltransferase
VAFLFHDPLKTILIIAGPTASGKTELAIRLAKYFHTAIISADSRQCFRELNIGTAKPSPAQLAEVPHYFINSHSVHDDFGAGQWAAAALQKLDELFAKQNVVIVCGGTGLYLKALTEGLDELPPADKSIRQRMKSQYEKNGLDWLRNLILEKDPLYFQMVDSNNPARLLRAAELIEQTGRPFSELIGKGGTPLPFAVKAYVPEWNRQELYSRINQRVENMMAEGLLEEVKCLRDLSKMNALQTVGYRELFEHLDGKISLKDAVEKIKQHTRNYAKRQLTWFRNQGQFRFVPVSEAYELILNDFVT